MTDSLLGLPSIRDTTDISLRALKLNALLDRWVAKYDRPFTSANNPVFCLCCAFTTPWLGVDALQLCTRIWAWITALDDAFDRDFECLDQVRACAERCREVLRGRAPEPEDQLAVSLAEIRDQVVGFPHFAALAPLWHRTVAELVDGMELERQWAGTIATGAQPPDLERYLEQASRTVGIPMYMVSLWATMDTAALPLDLSQLFAPLQDAALAVRLANDLRGHAREEAQEDVNALLVGMTPDEVEGRISFHVDRCRDQLRPLVERSLASAVALERLTVWCTRLYEQIDFRSPGA